MIYLYDKALVKDLEDSFNPEHVDNPLVRVVDPENAIGLAAQMRNDEVTYPIVALTRDENAGSPKTEELNFSRMHSGVVSAMDKKTNYLFYEKALPINLSYKMTLLTTNIADMDELKREVIFKYLDMYFLSITLPYECNRRVRFGIKIAPDAELETTSSTPEYLGGGKLYQTIVPLICEGCVYVHYKAIKLKRFSSDVEIAT